MLEKLGTIKREPAKEKNHYDSMPVRVSDLINKLQTIENEYITTGVDITLSGGLSFENERGRICQINLETYGSTDNLIDLLKKIGPNRDVVFIDHLGFGTHTGVTVEAKENDSSDYEYYDITPELKEVSQEYLNSLEDKK